MLKIACMTEQRFEVSEIETSLNKNLNTIDAFRLIENAYPNDDRYFLIGADNFVNILKWKENCNLINNYSYIVFEREGIDLKSYIYNNFKNKKINILIVKNNKYNRVSASKYRMSLNEDLLPEGVDKYIKDNSVY